MRRCRVFRRPSSCPRFAWLRYPMRLHGRSVRRHPDGLRKACESITASMARDMAGDGPCARQRGFPLPERTGVLFIDLPGPAMRVRPGIESRILNTPMHGCSAATTAEESDPPALGSILMAHRHVPPAISSCRNRVISIFGEMIVHPR